MPVYLDYNASAPIDLRVLSKMNEVYTNHYGNADSRTHFYGTTAKEIVEGSRRTIADILGVDSMDLFFTSGSTESNNIAILGILDYAKKTGKTHFITTSIEHKSILEAMKYLESQDCTVDYVSPNESGRIDPSHVLQLVNEKTLLVSVMHVNSETGIIQPVDELGEELAQRGVFFHIDATQSFGKLNSVIRSMKYDMMSITAHKIGGPQGIGALVLKRGNDYRRPPVKPIMFGGPQERGYRPGTTPVALVAGFSLAAQLCENEVDNYYQKCTAIKNSFLNAISELQHDINGDQDYCLPSTINISFSGVDAEGVFLAMKDVYAFSNGSACTSNSHIPSYVLTAMGLSEHRVNEALRISWGPETNMDFKPLVEYVRSMA